MIHTARSVGTLQALAMTVGVALFLWSTGLPTLFRIAEAASITSASDTLSNSAPSLASNHTVTFTSPNGMIAGQTIEITFDNAFTIPALGLEDFDLTASGTEQTLATSNGSGVWGVSTSSQTITFTSRTDVPQASGTIFSIEIGTHASAPSLAGNTQIVNPSATTSYPIEIDGSMPDSGQIRVAIIDQVTVTANVDTSLTFTVAGVAANATVNGTATTSTTSTNIALPFGTLPTGQSRILAHDLTVTTNAASGYTVTVLETGPLQSTTGAVIDGFVDGSNTNTPTPWASPTAVLADTATYGHWGITSDDATITARSGIQFVANAWVSPSTTPIAIMGHTGPSDGTTSGSGAARVGYRAEISALQEAGDDYTTTLRYIATPVF